MSISAYIYAYKVFIFCIIGIFISIICIRKIYNFIVKRENIYRKDKSSKIFWDEVNKHFYFWNIFGIVLMSIVVIFISIASVLNFPALPNVIQHKYKTSECVIEGRYTKEENSQSYCSASGETIRLFYYKNLEVGTKVKIHYFEHLRIGTIVKVIDDEEIQKNNVDYLNLKYLIGMIKNLY